MFFDYNEKLADTLETEPDFEARLAEHQIQARILLHVGLRNDVNEISTPRNRPITQGIR